MLLDGVGVHSLGAWVPRSVSDALLPYSKKSRKGHRDAFPWPYLDRSWRIQWSCQNIARSVLGLSGSSPRKQGSRLQTCRRHLKCLGLKDEIIEGAARETKSQATVTGSSSTEHTHTHTGCSDAVHCCLLPHTQIATLTPSNPATLSFLPVQTGTESLLLVLLGEGGWRLSLYPSWLLRKLEA